MIGKEDVLKLIAERSREMREVSYRDLCRHFDISDEAACLQLRRLWQARLIKVTAYRPEGAEYALQRGESIRELEFRLSKRGRERLEWFAAREHDGWKW